MSLELNIHADADTMGRDSAQRAANILRAAIQVRGSARIVVATGASQFTVLKHLVAQDGIDWSCIDGFHLDEYVGIDDQHPASFCRYLRERFVSQVPLRSFTYLDGTREPRALIASVGSLLQAAPIDLALIGIGENAHLAFNDPPADFQTLDPYILVELDHACRMQQVGEGWFASLEQVPTHAISMSIQQILSCDHLICSVPDQRKAVAVRDSVLGAITPMVPASILAQHPRVVLNLDRAAASLLPGNQS